MNISIPIAAHKFCHEKFGPGKYELVQKTKEKYTWCYLAHNQTKAYLKRYNATRPFKQEQQALDKWAPALGERGLTLLAVFHTEQCLLTKAELDPLAKDNLNDKIMWQIAAETLHQLHQINYQDEDRLQLAQALKKRHQALLQEAQTYPELQPFIGNELDKLLQLIQQENPQRKICHRDYTPDNWLWNSRDKKFTVLDFEHCHADWIFFDFAPLSLRYWPHAPEMKNHFFLSYKDEFNLFEDQLHYAKTFYALRSYCWSKKQNDTQWLRESEAMLNLLKK